ncbi:MAG: RNA polymerase sigma factor [Planctomycetales bacterium]
MAHHGSPAIELELNSRSRVSAREYGAAADHDRFRAMYDRYVRSIYQYCFRRLPTTEDAEDATSLIFAKAMSSLSQQRDDAALRAWLFSIAHNVVADHYRSRRVTVDLASVEPHRGLIESPESQALAADELRTLLNQLPEEQARILELRLAGLNGPEIARVLGKSHSAVKVAQFRAYSRLRQLLEPSQNAIGAAR